MLQRVVDREYQHLRQAAKDQTQKNVAEVQAEGEFCRLNSELFVPVVTTTPVARGPTRAQQESRLQRERRKAKYEAVVQLHQQGMGKRAIARALGLSRMTVRRYCQAGEFPEMASRGSAGKEHPKQLDAYREYLNERWEHGIRSGTVLWNEIRAQGFTGSLTAVYRLLRIWRAQDTATPKRFVISARSHCVPVPSPRQMSWWLLYPAKASFLNNRRQGAAPALEAQALAEAFKEKSPPIRAVTSRCREFIEMVTNRRADRLDGWLQDAAGENVPELTHFVKSLRQDLCAVRGALTYEWSNGQVEGHVNRLKMIKRQMYGRAGFPLLRQRVLAGS